MSEADRSKLRVGARPNGGSCVVTATHFETGEVLTFPYAAAAAEYFKVSSPTIHQAYQHGSKVKGVWVIDKKKEPLSGLPPSGS